MTQAAITFEQACQDAVNRLRAALVELYDSVEADPLSPQDVARRFRLNKTLTWNVSRLIQAPEGLAAVSQLFFVAQNALRQIQSAVPGR